MGAPKKTRFAANLQQSGTAAVGSCHYPPNGERGADQAVAPSVVTSATESPATGVHTSDGIGFTLWQCPRRAGQSSPGFPSRKHGVDNAERHAL
jgi:hypothetical protein